MSHNCTLDQLIHAAFESFPRSVILINNQGKIEYINPKAGVLLGVDKKQALGKNLHKIVHRPSQTQCKLTQALEQKRALTNVSDVFYSQSGEKIGVEYSLYPLFEKENGTKLIGFLLRFVKESFSVKQKNRFLAALGHELKTPLTVIKSYNQLIGKTLSQHLSTKKLKNSSLKKYFKVVDDKVDWLTKLIDGMLDTIKLGQGKLSFNDQLLDFDQEVRQAIEQLQKTTASHHLQLSGSTGAKLKIDRNRLYQIISNLVGNAVKYSPDSDKVKISLSKKKNFAVLKVKDFGQGITQEDQVHIFKPFFRSKDVEQKPGLGMGLFLTKLVVDHYQGKIKFDSKDNEGTSFTVKLPISRSKIQ